jgi:hypothetical protein
MALTGQNDSQPQQATQSAGYATLALPVSLSIRRTSMGQAATHMPQPVHFCWSSFFTVMAVLLGEFMIISVDNVAEIGEI